MKTSAALLVSYFTVWISLGVVLYSLDLSLFQKQISVELAVRMVLSCTVGLCAGFVAVFAPGGLGVREAVAATLLAQSMSWPEATFLVLVFRVWIAGLELASTATLYFWFGRPT